MWASLCSATLTVTSVAVNLPVRCVSHGKLDGTATPLAPAPLAPALPVTILRPTSFKRSVELDLATGAFKRKVDCDDGVVVFPSGMACVRGCSARVFLGVLNYHRIPKFWTY